MLYLDKRNSTFGLNYNPVSWLAEIIEFKKGVIIWVYKEGDSKDTRRYT